MTAAAADQRHLGREGRALRLMVGDDAQKRDAKVASGPGSGL